uniref:Transposase-associated domain-containing protein n=1 Tax=Ananas comosus var. bracteatus TaxID=296719 RepID=A0A6V7PQP7_ANACO|nr:unnamed protein product [Ananas comosus var. bracteatus]
MTPSKRWMDLVDDRLSEAYEMGVQSFLNYAFKRTGKNKEIRCPCVKCGNTYSGTRELVESHLKVYRIVQNYTFWYHHGERSGEPQSESDGDDGEEIEEDESENEMHEIIRDLYPEFSDVYLEFSDVCRDFENSNSMSNDEIEEEPNDEAKKFYRWKHDKHSGETKQKVAQIHKQDNNLIMEDLLSLSRGPTKYVTCYNGYLINGYKFRIEDIDKGLRTQNSGVVAVGDTGSETERRDYYGKTQSRDIYEMPLEMDEDSNDLQNKVEAYQQFESFISINAASTSQNIEDEVNWNRKDMEPMIIDITSTRKKKKQKS